MVWIVPIKTSAGTPIPASFDTILSIIVLLFYDSISLPVYLVIVLALFRSMCPLTTMVISDRAQYSPHPTLWRMKYR